MKTILAVLASFFTVVAFAVDIEQGNSVERVNEFDDGNGYVDCWEINEGSLQEMENGFVVVANEAGNTQGAYGVGLVDGIERFLITAEPTGDAKTSVILSPSGQRFELTPEQGLLGSVGDSDVEVIDLSELESIGCDAVVAYFLPAAAGAGGLLAPALGVGAAAAGVAALQNDGTPALAAPVAVQEDEPEVTPTPVTPTTPVTPVTPVTPPTPTPASP